MNADVTSPSVLDETRASVAEIAVRSSSGKASARHAQRKVCRWIARGVVVNGRVVKLEAARVGGKYVTSFEAFDRFVRACSERPPLEVTLPDRTPAQRDRDSEEASKKLYKLFAKAGSKPLGDNAA